MECDEDDEKDVINSSAVNSIILDYYKKFGRNRDLEQYFSLSTAQGEVRDPTGTFWRNMKVHNDSSDSGGKKSESSQELCRISIKCSIPDPSSSQDENTRSKTEAISPPIITEDFALNVSRPTSRGSDDGSGKSGDENSQKSLDMVLDTSMNKALSPTSSVTSQRKLEWDSLADVGYANESDRKMSASSLSTLERLALQQQYSNNETRQDLGPPTAHSTPLDEIQTVFKSKKGIGKKSIKIHKKDVESVELNVPQNSINELSQCLNVNLTKHISFSVNKSGELLLENIKNDLDVSPQKAPVDTVVIPQENIDKEIQTTVINTKENTRIKDTQVSQKTPILMNVNTLKKKNRRRKFRLAQKKARYKKNRSIEKESINVQGRSGGQLSEAESFEYMPGHIYNEKHLKLEQSSPKKIVNNKSSLESSGVLTTDSSNGSKHSFTNDLERSIELLKGALQQRYDDNLKNKLVKEIIQRLLKSKYRDDDSTTDFLSGLSFGSKNLGLEHSNTTSSGDGNNSTEKIKMAKPKKSILRMDKFNANAISSTSQSAPNLPTATHSDKPISSKFIKHLTSSNTDSDISSLEKASTNTIFPRTTSEELYRKYLDALKKEESYKKHLKDKEIFLKQKLTSSDSVFKILKNPDDKMSNRKFQDLMNDLIRNNYDDGSGDATKLEGGSDSNINYERLNHNNHRSHSVYTLSSCNTNGQSKKPNLKKRLQTDLHNSSRPGSTRENVHYCCCPHHSMNNKYGVSDSCVQVNFKELNPSNEYVSTVNKSDDPSQKMPQICSRHVTDDIKYVCLCSEKVLSQDVCDKFLVYKCSRLTSKGIQSDDISCVHSKPVMNSKNNCACKCVDTESHALKANIDSDLNKEQIIKESSSDNAQLTKVSKSSQTNMLLNMLSKKHNEKSDASSASDLKTDLMSNSIGTESTDFKVVVHEATRCIQTEISINPQISDPSLPDIHIINDAESVKIISEQVKEVSNCNSVDHISKRDDRNNHEVCYKNIKKLEMSQDKIDETYKRKTVNDKLFNGSENNNDQQNNIGINEVDIVTDNFTIPIQGTNMKLMVSIGSNDHRKSELSKTDSKPVKQSLREKSDYSQESTSADEISCNSVQYQTLVNKELSANINNPHHVIDHNSNNINSKLSKVQFQQFDKSCCGSLSGFKFNTYPINEKKPSLPSNTDTGKFVAYTQTDDIHSGNIMSQKTNTHIDNDNQIASETYLSQSPDSIAIVEVKNKHTTVETPKKAITTDTETQSDIPYTILPIESTNDLKNYIDNNYISSKYAGNFNMEAEKKEISNQLINQSETLPETQSVYNSEVEPDSTERSKSSDDKNEKFVSHIPNSNKGKQFASGTSNDPILNLIKDITKKYSKDDIEKHKRKKCFKEIVTVLNYLLDTDDSTDHDHVKTVNSCRVSNDNVESKTEKPVTRVSESCQTITKVDKGVQMTMKKFKNRLRNTESSDMATSTDLPSTSTDSATCKVLNKIKKECERYHQKRCKSHGGGKICDASSSTSANCNQCNKIHHCSCRLHKCKAHKSKPKSDKTGKKSVAYNLIIQTSESMISEETVRDNNRRPLKNIIVRVPSRGNEGFIPFKELETKIEKKMSHCSPRCNTKYHRSKSCPNEYEKPCADDRSQQSQECTVREYLEINRPDFIEKCVQRQDCLKVINKSRDKYSCPSPRLKMVVVHTPNCMGSVANCNMYCGGVPMTCNACFDPCTQTIQSEVTRIANERAVNRELLSAHVDRESPLSALNIDELRQLARDIGIKLTPKKHTQKILSERDMKKHSEKIYKSLPEVRQKKEEARKENIKKTNLLMANIFKKNLQKKALRGSVNLSNYSTVIKI